VNSPAATIKVLYQTSKVPMLLVVVGVVGWLCLLAAGHPYLGFGLLILCGWLAILNASLLRGKDRFNTRSDWRQQSRSETRATQTVQDRFPGVELPISPAGMDPTNLLRLLDELDRLKPRHIVEIGPGVSTQVFAAWLRRHDRQGRVYSVEHDAYWSEQCDAWLKHNGLTDYATIITAPLVDTEAYGEPTHWYDPAALTDTLPGTIDLLLVDAPPSYPDETARRTALAVLADRVSPGGVVLLDDGNRPGETRVAELWLREHPGFTGELLETPSGLWRLERRKP